MSEPMRRVVAKFKLWNFLSEDKIEAGQMAPLEEECLVDTGTTNVIVPPRIVAALGLRSAGKVRVKYADGRSELRDVAGGLRLEIFGRNTECRAIVEPDRDVVLVGQIPLEDMDLLVDCKLQKVVPRDPDNAVLEALAER